jgi:hypothetical protein
MTVKPPRRAAYAAKQEHPCVDHRASTYLGGGLYKSHMKEFRNGMGKVVILWLRWLVTDPFHLRPWFDPWLVHMEFVMGKIALGQVFLSERLFSLVSSIPPMLHTFHLATTHFLHNLSK